MPQTLNVEFGSTAGSESGLSVKVRIPAGQLTDAEFRDLFCNGVLMATLSVGAKQHELWPQPAYYLAGRFQVESYTTFESEHKFTLACDRWTMGQHDVDPATMVLGDHYLAWGMWSALAGKSGTLDVERVGRIERKPVGRPRKQDGDPECYTAAEMDADAGE